MEAEPDEKAWMEEEKEQKEAWGENEGGWLIARQSKEVKSKDTVNKTTQEKGESTGMQVETLARTGMMTSWMEKHCEETTKESEMMWDVHTIGNHSCTSLLRTKIRNERSG